MAINYFIGWDVKDLEDALRIAQEDLAAGKSIIQSGAGDANMQNRVEKSIECRIEMILRALNLKDAEKYPVTEISRVTTTKASFQSQSGCYY